MEGLKEITPEEQQLIDKMRQNLKHLNLEGDQLDAKNLVRYLRARNHCPEKAGDMFRKQLDFRERHDMDHILEWEFPPEYKTYWPCYASGLDLLGNPVIILQKGLWDPSKVKEVPPNVFLRYNLYNQERTWQLAQHFSQGHKVMRQCTTIMDMKGMSWNHLTTMDYMQTSLEAFRSVEANYPEILHVCFIVNAPYVFNVGYNLVRPFMSSYTHSKIRLLSSCDRALWREEICKVVDASQFPQRYGGDQLDSIELKFPPHGFHHH